mmetsp:Transcript_24331/g.42598  ORF Transcript_24331/g.42598 Transcript_24331/m.42598 type:complete len:165 (-) Transcript_24331:66-560(-)
MMFFSRNEKQVVSLVAMVLYIASHVEASIYERVGDGLCQPAPDKEYSHIVKYGYGANRAYDCSEACDGVNDSGERYRGFSIVNGALRGSHDCLCFYDCHHLPEFSTELEDVWSRHDPEYCAEGQVSAWDNATGVICYQALVAEKSVLNPEGRMSSTLLESYNGA